MWRSYLKVLLVGLGLQVVFPVFAGDITILFTHDLHSMFLPHRKYCNGQVVERGGYARLYTAIEKIRAQNPEQTVLVDAGDFSSGSLFYTLFPTASTELQLMALMGYEATTPGNHDFDFGVDGLAGALTAARQTGLAVPAIVAANTNPAGVAVQRLRTAFDTYPVTAYTVLEKSGKRIGIFGLIGDEAVGDAPMAAAVTFENRFEAARRVVKQLRDKERADIIVCLSHSGTGPTKAHSEDEQLAEKVPGIDIIISGHTHSVLHEPLPVQRTLIVSAGCYGEYLGVLTIDADTRALRQYRLVPIDSTLAGDEHIAAKINAFQEALNTVYFDSLGRRPGDTVCFNPHYIPAEPVNSESALGNLIADAYVAALPPTALGGNESGIAVVPRGTIRADLFPGQVTNEQLFSILSIGVGRDNKAGYPLVCVYLTGAELWDLCEVDASCAPLLPDAQLSFSGLQYTCHPHRLFCNRVTDVRVKTAAGDFICPDNDSLYPVVGSLYAAQMLGMVEKLTYGILSIQPKDKAGRPVEDYRTEVLLLPEGLELKEWLALSNYLQAPAGNGALPESLATCAGAVSSKTIHTGHSLYEWLKQPNGFARTVYAAVLLLLAGVAVVAFRIIRRLRRITRIKNHRKL